MTQDAFFTTLKNRGLIRISGAERRDFLQGLITNDISRLDARTPLLYTCLLTPQGKFLYDFFISEKDNALLLDCEGGTRMQDLAKLLSMYKLRADITIETTPDHNVYALIGQAQGLPDPRHADIGTRSFEKPIGITQKPFEDWDKRRIALCIPDGSRDMIPKTSTVLECGMDRLNGVSFDKGCYMGQELTARTHYRGLIKKHLRVVTPDMLGLAHLPAFGTPIMHKGAQVGDMRSSCGDIGLASLKDEFYGAEGP